ncbi:LysR family transcriptional regulator [Saxibacter everestensis]|uniref:LysR family transcriptional regulator n=1 Tax=Saxibacter everestensis TaxID=2909229 RepID=A0ABY8QVJ1_9MICO|nr:LysR family transcriptional regulator [Brevibacteriaceae bacterium ZFBP1038]
MDVSHLSLLRELAERGSITAVAEATHRTPSAVSQQLKTMQRELGAPLVERHGRGVRLTSAGNTLAAAAVDVATALSTAQAVWDEFRGSNSGTVDLVLFPSAGQLLLPRLLAKEDLLSGIELRCDDRDVRTEAFAALTADADIVVAHHVFEPPPWTGSRLTAVPLLREPLDIALPEDHPLAAKTTCSPRDVRGERWIGVPEGFPFDHLVKQIGDLAGQPVTVVQRLRDNRIIEALVAAGHGISVLPRYAQAATPGSGVVLRPITGLKAGRRMVALMRPDRAERRAVRQVLRGLTEAAAEITAGDSS